MSDYSRIRLDRDFRPHVLAALRALPNWDHYRASNGIPSNGPYTREGIISACLAMGYDLSGARAAFDTVRTVQAALDATAAPQGAPLPPQAPLTVPPLAPLAPSSAGPGEPIEEAAPAPEAAPLAKHDGDEGEGEADPEGEPPEGEAPVFEGRAPEDIVAEILAPLSVFLPPHAAQQLPALLAPLAREAAKPARIVTITAAPAGAPSAVPHARPVRWAKPFEAFGLSVRGAGAHRPVLVDGGTIPVCDYALAPPRDKSFIWSAPVLSALALADITGMNLWAFGPAGTGKSESVQQYAATLRRPFTRIPVDRSKEGVDFIGQLAQKDGNTVWRDGNFTAAMRIPYNVVLLDEPTLLRPGAIAVLQTVLDFRKVYLPTGEIVELAPGILIVAADNTSGTGDETGQYADTAMMNHAFMTRFGIKYHYEYLSAAAEAHMVHGRTLLPLAACRVMTEFAALTRSDCDKGKLAVGIGPRALISWAKAVKAGLPSSLAYELAVANGAAPEDKAPLAVLASASLGHATIDIHAGGQSPAKAAPGAAPVDPAPSQTGTQFPPQPVA
jgi:MoxR-like ATPase